MESRQLSASIAAGHEPSGFNTRAVVVSLIIMFVLLVFSLAVAWYLLEAIARTEVPAAGLVADGENVEIDAEASAIASGDNGVVRSLPALSVRQKKERLKYVAEQNELLTSYGWSDPQKTTVRIPIERAMELTVKRYGEKP